jgi:Replication initiator protein, pSAM2
VHCHVCQAPRYEQAHRQQQLLFLLLLAQAIQPPDEDDNPYDGLRRWAHMLGFGGHFLTKSRRYSIAFRILREARIVFRRTETTRPTAENADADCDGEQTTLLINSLTLAGVGWHTSADAMLAQTSSALAREHQQLARHLIDAIEI